MLNKILLFHKCLLSNYSMLPSYQPRGLQQEKDPVIQVNGQGKILQRQHVSRAQKQGQEQQDPMGETGPQRSQAILQTPWRRRHARPVWSRGSSRR